MNTAALVSTFGLVFVAELGDKTQLAAMALAARYPWGKVFGGIAAAFVLLNLAAVSVGRVLFDLVPLLWLQLGSAALFAWFGVSALRARADAQGEGAIEASGRRPALTAFLMILTAELGDKTQLATAGLAAQLGAPAEVFLGSTLALWSVSLLGIFLGRQIGRVLRPIWVQRAGGALFLLFSAAALYQALA